MRLMDWDCLTDNRQRQDRR
ncbi:Protein of unknown function [Pyronema omphalodes CBS 100304]|uniref:Uncharacterized protein n=1 Tax=Pyronema omphalodes (strain CBS 100304) TaxID=1076935 RepID=U4LT83_PYROM|nr:Protein of unknown function [Pyronema omphalodes CBS 100304]